MNIKKTLLGVLLAIIILLPVIFTPQPAQAQFTDPAAVVQRVASRVWTTVKWVYSQVKGRVGTQLATQTLSMYMNTFSHDIATQLATGGPGGKPQFRTLSIKDSLQKAQDAAVGDFMGELTSAGFDELGINLCDPSLDVKLTATLALVDSKDPPKPKCDWRDVQRKWEDFATDFTDIEGDPFGGLTKIQLNPKAGGESWNTFWKSFSLEQSDFGVYSKIMEKGKQLEEEAIRVSELSAEECQGYIDDKKVITEQVKTHCSAQSNLFESQFEASNLSTQEELKIAQRGEATSLSDIIKQSASMFMNTFTSKLLKHYVQRGMHSLFGSDDGIYDGYRDSILNKLRGGADILHPRGQDIFQEFKKVTIEPVSDFSLLENFVICPAQIDFRQPDNCVIKATFLQAVTAKKTIQEAIDEGIINGNAALIGVDDIERNNSDECYRDAFCYHNLIKLRKANIIPIGWEIAASRSSVTDPVTIQEAIDCFEDKPESNCIYDADDDYNDHNPFYHLIDGDWVLKAPPVLCEAFVYSSTLESYESNNRQQNCVDAKVCLREDDAGNCLDNQFGYCTKTENIWRFGADICQDGDIYAGCLTFDNEDIGSNSYIEGSLDYCTSDEAGCKRYSQDLSFDGQWILTDIEIDDDDLFLNRRASECSSDEAGCSEYIVLSADRGINSIPNGDFNQDFLDGENLANPDGIPDGWSSDGADYDGDRIANGYIFDTPRHPDTEAIRQQIILLPNTTYVFSAKSAQHEIYGGIEARLVVKACDISGDCDDTSQAAGLENGGTCALAVGNHSQAIDLQFTPDDEDMQRASCTFTTNRYTYSGLLDVSTSAGTGLLWFDDVKLEMVSSVDSNGTTYSPYGDGGRIVINGDRLMCTVDEVGCQGYTPINGDPMIPAVISQDDLCPLECVDYATFAQQPDRFDIIEEDLDVEYYNFIADTATQCSLLAVGCEEFTNLDEVAQGGEGREYYTYLRQCVLQNNSNAKSYFTWEGNDVAGYQLKTWFALESNLSDAPCTNIDINFPDDCNDTADTIAICDDPEINPNCREFFDEDNDSHFRLQDRVIFASNDCHDYRRTLTATEFRAIPSLSRACSAAELGCREYYGNTANNIRNIFSDNFESGSYEPWDGDLDISNESLANNGHSMKINDPAAFNRDLNDVELQNKKLYKLSWWMKGDDFIDSVDLFFNHEDIDGVGLPDPFTSDDILTDIEAGNWHYYSVSHYIDIADFHHSVDLTFNIVSDSDVFIDNVILKEISDSVSVIKDSWNTPLSCNLHYEGYHLGCQAYVDTNNNRYNLKSFTHLCREDAIGCAPVIDTHNSTNPFEQTFNPSSCSDPAFITEADCVLPEIWTNEYSEITVLADNVDYLVPDSGKYCNVKYKGCQMLGLPVRGGEDDEFNTVYKINDPDQYGFIMCIGDALMCEEFQSDKGTYYFKDPINNTCTYQKNVLAIFDTDPFDEFEGNEQMFDGWWLSSTLGSDNPLGCSDGQNEDEPGVLDRYIDLEYSSTIAATCPQSKNLCTGFKDSADPVGCDPTIDGVTGMCSDESIFNKFDCEAIDEIWTPACQTYYYYNNEKIDESSCSGVVDRNNGCILLYETNNWDADHREIVTLYDTITTYDQNTEENRPVSPFVCPDVDDSCENTANVLVKVDKDRQCAEWMSCKSASAAFNDFTNEYEIICDKLDICEEYDSENNITKCKRWKAGDDLFALETEVYQSRTSGTNDHLDWSDLEYTGMSMLNMLPIDSLISYNFNTTTDEELDNPRLVFDACNWLSIDEDYPDCYFNDDLSRTVFYDCYDDIDHEPGLYDGQPCSVSEFGYFYGTCWDETCWLNPRLEDDVVDRFGIESRGYATSDAPFPKDISRGEDGKDRLQSYINANICDTGIPSEDGEDEYIPNGCEETYTKITFGNSGHIRYYSKDADKPKGICTSGEIDLPSCDDNIACDTVSGRFDGRCEPAKKIELVYNWSGVCIEHDKSSSLIDDKGGTYNCNQWYPVQKIEGTNSLFDNYVEAGYYNPSGQDALFCAVAEPYTLEEKRTYCLNKFTIGETMDYCTVLVEVPAGTRVHLDIAEDYGDVIVNGYLDTSKRTKYLQSPADDGVIDEDDGPGALPSPLMDQTGDYTGEDSSLINILDTGLGVDFIEKNTATAENHDSTSYQNFPLSSKYDSLFNGGDFCRDGDSDCNLASPIPILPFTQLDEIFYVNPALGPSIEYFYYDEQIKYNGNEKWSVGIPLQDRKVVKTYTCSNDHGNGSQTSCGVGWHEAKFRQRYQGKHCGWGGPRRHYKWRYCNPLSYNIYVNASIEQTEWLCTQTDCSEAPPTNLGRTCLKPTTGPDTLYEEIRNNTTDGIKPWSWIEPKYDIDHPAHPFPECLTELECDAACAQCQIDNPTWPLEDCLSEVNNCVERATSTVAVMLGAGADDSLCYDNPNCKFVHCVESLSLPGHDVYDELGGAVTNIDFCDEFGGIEYSVNDGGTPDDPSDDTLDPIGIQGCWDRIFVLGGGEDYTTIATPIDEDIPIDETLPLDTLEVRVSLVNGPNGVEECLQSENETACINPYNIGHCEGNPDTQCEVDGDCGAGDVCVLSQSGMIDFDSCYYIWHWPGGVFNWNGWWVEVVCPETYIASSSGTPCNLGSLDEDGCYQQCSLVTQLDSLGNNSWVRTDIWHRSYDLYPENKIFNWDSYYYNSLPSIEYKEGPEIFMRGLVTIDGQINFDPYSPFGSAWGSPDTEVVVTRVPISGSHYSDLSVATFFEHDTDPSTPPSTEDDPDWISAANKLLYLFANTYNFIWTDTDAPTDQVDDTYEYVFVDNLFESPDVGWVDNPFTGEDYDPQILQVCDGNELCTSLVDPIIANNGITINNLNDVGDEVIGRGSLFVALKFFYHAHPDHMPITNIDIDWNDSNAVSSYPGRYKNSMESCKPTQEYTQTEYSPANGPADGSLQGFGGETRACREGYKVFYNDYVYDAIFDCATRGVLGYPNAACYKPSVTVTDRWGQTRTEEFDGWIIIRNE